MAQTASRGTDRRVEDPRAVETRRRLVAAFLELSAVDDGDLTVPQIVEGAGLHRSSFYAHFGSVDDLALYALDRDLDQVHAANLTRQNARAMTAQASNALVIAEILEQVASPANPLAAVLRHDRALGEDALGRQLQDRVTDYYDQLPSFAGLARRSRAASAEYIGHGLAAIICAWLVGELSTTQEHLADWLALLVPEWVMTAMLTAGVPDSREA
jgi:AcrR family transcriptional regulator